MKTAFSVQQIASGPCFSYLLESEGQALLIDPHITKADVYRQGLLKKGLRLAGIVDTHTHADHISSAAILVREYRCPLYMSPKAVSSLTPKRLSQGDAIEFGSARLDVWESPGHTDDSIALVGGGCIFTGDVLLIGSVGRTDFQNGSPGDMFDTLARFKTLADDTVVYPAHDYKNRTQSTMGQEKRQNPFMAQTDKQAFVADAGSKILPKPFNMDRIIQVNRQGTAREIEFIAAEQVKERLDKGWQILDVRRPDEYKAVRIMPSVNIPMDALASRLPQLTAGTKWILSCRSGGRAAIAAGVLLAAGLQDFCVAGDSLNGWLKKGYPVIREKVPMSLERQVRMIAGGLVAAGALLAILFSKWFLIIPLWVGCGLFYAGVSDSCMMGMLLMKLPYNKRAMEKQAAPGGSCSLGGGSCAMDAGKTGGTCAM
ncbi:MAG: MBL fold metallo-hydrolase [Planctomycetales bacterium]|nr:MBL fold metallo-hydrolase [Planctomycetales bacterium]